jgi:putative transposase
VISINGKRHWLWRAVDADGLWRPGSRPLVQGREGRRAAEKLAAERLAVEKLAVENLLRKLIRKPSRTPCVMVTDKPGSDGAARTGMGLNVEHRQHKGLNNRAKNAHLPTRRRKRIIKRFTSARHVKRLVFIHNPIANLQTVPATPCRHQPGC